MQFSVEIVLFLLIPSAMGSYKITQENLTLDFINHNYMEAKAGCYKLNDDIALNVTFKLKVDVSENLMMYASGFKWLRTNYSVQVLQIQKTLKDAIEMELFDLQSLFVQHARPPVVWPVLKGTTYRIQGWIPDSTKFPPNLPAGKWKVRITGAFANKTKLSVFNWYMDVQYL